MGERGRGRWRQPTSRWVGLAVAGAYVVITAITGTALLVTGQQISEADAQAGKPMGATARYTDTITVTRDPSTVPRPTSTHTPPPSTRKQSQTTTTTTAPMTEPAQRHPDVPSGYQRVHGPGGMTTTVPATWAQHRTTGPGAMLAVDPRDALRYVKYGGSATPDNDMLAVHLMYESSFAARSVGYKRLALSETTFHGADAVVWEFQVTGAGGLRHVKSLYWRMRGTEYFVFAADVQSDWARMTPIYDRLVAGATP
jgi:hypothetical protein